MDKGFYWSDKDTIENDSVDPTELEALSNFIKTTFEEKYLSWELVDDVWEDCISEAAETAEVTPGESDHIANDPQFSYQGWDASLDNYSPDYYEAIDITFKAWLEKVLADPAAPDILKQNMDDNILLEYFKDSYTDYCIPMLEDDYEDKVWNALNENSMMDDDFNWDI